MQDIVMEVKNLSKSFGAHQVVCDVSFQVKKGDFVTLLGPSGCGKTTILRMIAGFYEPDSGTISLEGRRIERLPAHERNTAMVFQEYALFPHLNVYENVAYGLRVRHFSEETIRDKVGEMLTLMQLSGLEGYYPNEISGGQQQRVAVARALVLRPGILLLDEPLSNLDAKLREEMRDELRRIQQQMGLATLYVTHDQQEALSMSDSLIVMQDGRLHQQGKPHDIYFSPRTPFVADFIGTTNLISVEGRDALWVNYGEDVLELDALCPNGTYTVSIRPEAIRLSENMTSPWNGNLLRGTITHSMFMGEKIRYFLLDPMGHEWLADVHDPGGKVYTGEVSMMFLSERTHLIVEGGGATNSAQA